MSEIIIALFLGIYYFYTSITTTTSLTHYWKPYYVKFSSWNRFSYWHFKIMKLLVGTFFNGQYFPISNTVFSCSVLSLFGLGIFSLFRKRRWNYLIFLLGPLILLYLTSRAL